MNFDYYGRRRKRRGIDRLSLQVSIAGMLFCAAAAFLISASAGDLREFVLCDHKTGHTAAHLTIDGIVTTGIWKVKPETVVEVVPIEGDKCTMVVTNKSQASVVGSAAEVECRLLGGDGCAAIKAKKQ